VRFVELARRVRAQIGQDHRYEHTVRVARCAEILAQRHGIDTRRARLAGMLHDLARLYPADRLVEECERRGMPIDAFERAQPVVLHARLGAALAGEMFGIDDPEILSAIRKHTVGAAAMSPLDCALYLADGLEPGRRYPERGPLWQIALRDLDEAMRATIVFSCAHLTKKGLAIAPQTVAAAHAFGVSIQEEVQVSAN
jgi:predicted HD superfamily hydrolase involved in NAD metabolism